MRQKHYTVFKQTESATTYRSYRTLWRPYTQNISYLRHFISAYTTTETPRKATYSTIEYYPDYPFYNLDYDPYEELNPDINFQQTPIWNKNDYAYSVPSLITRTSPGSVMHHNTIIWKWTNSGNVTKSERGRFNFYDYLVALRESANEMTTDRIQFLKYGTTFHWRVKYYYNGSDNFLALENATPLPKRSIKLNSKKKTLLDWRPQPLRRRLLPFIRERGIIRPIHVLFKSINTDTIGTETKRTPAIDTALTQIAGSILRTGMTSKRLEHVPTTYTANTTTERVQSTNTDKWHQIYHTKWTQRVLTTDTTGTRTQRVPVKIASCYVCGLNETGIPQDLTCYYVFEDISKKKTMFKKKYKKKCYLSEHKGKDAKGLYSLLFRGGCFKRFTDVGNEYNERGCRTMPPTKGVSYASKRFAALERTLYDVEDGCVFSPVASLTPFSRAVSLYVRYHVCVCSTRYCNRARQSLDTRLIALNVIVIGFLRTKYLLYYV